MRLVPPATSLTRAPIAERLEVTPTRSRWSLQLHRVAGGLGPWRPQWGSKRGPRGDHRRKPSARLGRAVACVEGETTGTDARTIRGQTLGGLVWRNVDRSAQASTLRHMASTTQCQPHAEARPPPAGGAHERTRGARDPPAGPQSACRQRRARASSPRPVPHSGQPDHRAPRPRPRQRCGAPRRDLPPLRHPIPRHRHSASVAGLDRDRPSRDAQR